jgi:hypothetical protein
MTRVSRCLHPFTLYGVLPNRAVRATDPVEGDPQDPKLEACSRHAWTRVHHRTKVPTLRSTLEVIKAKTAWINSNPHAIELLQTTQAGRTSGKRRDQRLSSRIARQRLRLLSGLPSRGFDESTTMRTLRTVVSRRPVERSRARIAAPETNSLTIRLLVNARRRILPG